MVFLALDLVSKDSINSLMPCFYCYWGYGFSSYNSISSHIVSKSKLVGHFLYFKILWCWNSLYILYADSNCYTAFNMSYSFKASYLLLMSWLVKIPSNGAWDTGSYWSRTFSMFEGTEMINSIEPNFFSQEWFSSCGHKYRIYFKCFKLKSWLADCLTICLSVEKIGVWCLMYM